MFSKTIFSAPWRCQKELHCKSPLQSILGASALITPLNPAEKKKMIQLSEDENMLFVKTKRSDFPPPPIEYEQSSWLNGFYLSSLVTQIYSSG